MRQLASAAVVTALLALAIACDKKEEPAAADAATATKATAVAPTTAAGDEPSEADFEEEAEKSINASNLEAEISKMEAELK